MKQANWLSIGLTFSMVFSAFSAGAQEPPKVQQVPKKAVVPGQAKAAVPGLAPGWPQVVAGSVTGTPVVADVDGDGELEVVVPAMQRTRHGEKLRHPKPTLACQLWALRQDGSIVPHWPITLRNEESRLNDRKKQPGLAENWAASPSVWDIEGDGADEIVIVTGGQTDRGTRLIYGDGGIIPLAADGDPWASVPLCDLDGDRQPDMVVGGVLTSILAKPVKTWPATKLRLMAYGAAMGDADGDELPEVYLPFYEKDWHLDGQPENKTVGGFDNRGEVLPGWPQKLPTIAIYVVLGDVVGDDKKEVVVVDTQGKVRVWTWDGQPLWSENKIQKTGRFASFAPPCLADLDGDGKAEIIVCESGKRMLHAWHGDGRPWRQESPTPAGRPLRSMRLLRVRDKNGQMRRLDPDNPDDRKIWEAMQAAVPQTPLAGSDGAVAALPTSVLDSYAPVSVVDLGNDGVMDFFIGTHWIRAGATGPTQTQAMLPDEEGAMNSTGCTLVDFDRDGTGEAIFGLIDGRVFVYRTGLSLPREGLQWPTPGGNFQHTGVWNNPRQPLQKP